MPATQLTNDLLHQRDALIDDIVELKELIITLEERNKYLSETNITLSGKIKSPDGKLKLKENSLDKSELRVNALIKQIRKFKPNKIMKGHKSNEEEPSLRNSCIFRKFRNTSAVDINYDSKNLRQKMRKVVIIEGSHVRNIGKIMHSENTKLAVEAYVKGGAPTKTILDTKIPELTEKDTIVVSAGANDLYFKTTTENSIISQVENFVKYHEKTNVIKFNIPYRKNYRNDLMVKEINEAILKANLGVINLTRKYKN